MWWKILIAIVCAVLIISPVDILSGLPFDDIVYALGLVSSVFGTIKGAKKKDDNDGINDVDHN